MPGRSRLFSVIAQGFDSGTALERVRHYTSLKIEDRDSAVTVICDESGPAVRSESESHRGSTGVHHKLLAMEVGHPQQIDKRLTSTRIGTRNEHGSIQAHPEFVARLGVAL